MLSPQVVSADSSTLFSLLRVLANPEEYKKQLEELQNAANSAIQFSKDGDEKIVELQKKEQELQTVKLKFEARVSDWQKTWEASKKDAEVRIQRASDIEAKAAARCKEVEEKASELLIDVENRTLQLEATIQERTENLREVEEKVKLATEKLAETHEALLTLRSKFS